MIYPSKFKRYNESSFKYFVPIIKVLKDGNLTVRQFRRIDKISKIPINDFIETLDCLYALGKIELRKGGIIHYVD